MNSKNYLQKLGNCQPSRKQNLSLKSPSIFLEMFRFFKYLSYPFAPYQVDDQ